MDYPFPEEQIGLPGFAHVTKESKKWWVITWVLLFIAFATYIGFLAAQAHQEGITPATRIIVSRNPREHMPAVTVCPLTTSETIELAAPGDSDAPQGSCVGYLKETGADADPTDTVRCEASLTSDGRCAVFNWNGNMTLLPRTDFVDIVVRVNAISANSPQGVSYVLSRTATIAGSHNLDAVDRFEAPFGSRSHVRWFRTAWKDLKKRVTYTYQVSTSSVALTSTNTARDSRSVVLRFAAGRAHDEMIEEYRPTTALVFIAAAGATWGYIVVVIACLFVPFYGRDGQRWVKLRFSKSVQDPIYSKPDQDQAVGPGGAWAAHRYELKGKRSLSIDDSSTLDSSAPGTTTTSTTSS